MKRITMSEDGIPRFTLKIEVRISAYDMAVHLMSRFQYKPNMSSSCKDDETTLDRDLRLEKNIKVLMGVTTHKELIDMVSDSIEHYGVESPHYSVSDAGYGTAVDFLCGYLTRKYPSFQKIK
jgi:hypothetical protein